MLLGGSVHTHTPTPHAPSIPSGHPAPLAHPVPQPESPPRRQIWESGGGPTVPACGPAVLIVCGTRLPVGQNCSVGSDIKPRMIGNTVCSPLIQACPVAGPSSPSLIMEFLTLHWLRKISTHNSTVKTTAQVHLLQDVSFSGTLPLRVRLPIPCPSLHLFLCPGHGPWHARFLVPRCLCWGPLHTGCASLSSRGPFCSRLPPWGCTRQMRGAARRW